MADFYTSETQFWQYLGRVSYFYWTFQNLPPPGRIQKAEALDYYTIRVTFSLVLGSVPTEDWVITQIDLGGRRCEVTEVRWVTATTVEVRLRDAMLAGALYKVRCPDDVLDIGMRPIAIDGREAVFVCDAFDKAEYPAISVLSALLRAVGRQFRVVAGMAKTVLVKPLEHNERDLWVLSTMGFADKGFLAIGTEVLEYEKKSSERLRVKYRGGLYRYDVGTEVTAVKTSTVSAYAMALRRVYDAILARSEVGLELPAPFAKDTIHNRVALAVLRSPQGSWESLREVLRALFYDMAITGEKASVVKITEMPEGACWFDIALEDAPQALIDAGQEVWQAFAGTEFEVQNEAKRFTVLGLSYQDGLMQVRLQGSPDVIIERDARLWWRLHVWSLPPQMAAFTGYYNVGLAPNGSEPSSARIDCALGGGVDLGHGYLHIAWLTPLIVGETRLDKVQIDKVLCLVAGLVNHQIFCLRSQADAGTLPSLGGVLVPEGDKTSKAWTCLAEVSLGRGFFTAKREVLLLWHL